MEFQVADVTQSLISVADMVDRGSRVTFEPGLARVMHIATGKCIDLKREGKTYYLEMVVPSGADEERESGFTRPEKR